MIKRVIIAISGMHCQNCANTIMQALKGTKGIHDASINLIDKKAYVIYEEINLGDIKKIIRSKGYRIEE